MRFPIGYGANLRKAFGGVDSPLWPAYLKIHDFHHLLQHIIPVAIIGLGSDDLRDAIWSLGKLLRWVCQKEIKEEEIPAMEIFGVEVVCKLEKALPPSFFDGQVHFLLHLVREVAIAGPVHCRWMFWVERYMGVTKSYVTNRARVEGSIAEHHLGAESAFYCTNILATLDPNAPRGWIDEATREADFEDDRLTGARGERLLAPAERLQITTFLLYNSPEVAGEWVTFYEEEKQNSRRPRIFPKFHPYMKDKLRDIDALLGQGGSVSHFPKVTDHLRTLVHGPLLIVTTRTAMWSKGRHFRIERLDEKRAAPQDCGVMGWFIQDSQSSTSDRNPIRSTVAHYGKIEEILTVKYHAHTTLEEVVLKCKWFKMNLVGQNRTCEEDPCGFTRLKTNSVVSSNWRTSDPFAFPHHLEQCFYLPYPDDEEWSIVMPYIPRSRSIVQSIPDVVVVEE
ncbi:unnamed protein product [Calypogeia fissa]